MLDEGPLHLPFPEFEGKSHHKVLRAKAALRMTRALSHDSSPTTSRFRNEHPHDDSANDHRQSDPDESPSSFRDAQVVSGSAQNETDSHECNPAPSQQIS
jgi:hypothetical protein